MNQWYIVLNIGLFILTLVLMYTYIIPHEASDIYKLNKKYREIDSNAQCIDYLQNVAATPTWRFAMISAAGFTLIELILYILMGFPIDQPKHLALFWILYILNTFFMYKAMGTWVFHYMCQNNCIPSYIS